MRTPRLGNIYHQSPAAPKREQARRGPLCSTWIDSSSAVATPLPHGGCPPYSMQLPGLSQGGEELSKVSESRSGQPPKFSTDDLNSHAATASGARGGPSL